jgi:large subunit ribosomal protein L21
MQVDAGQQVELGDVLLVAGNGEVHSGDDYTAKTKVVAEVAGHGRAPKVIVFKYKPKVRYRRKKGHRQDYTELFVRDILADGKSVAKAEKPTAKAPKAAPRRAARKQKAEIEEDVAEVAAGALADAPEQEVEPGKPATAPRGRRRQVKAVAEGALADAPDTEVEQTKKRAAKPASRPAKTRARKKKEE